MNPKPHFRRQLAFLSMPFLLLSPAAQAQDTTKAPIDAEALESKETEEQAAQR